MQTSLHFDKFPDGLFKKVREVYAKHEERNTNRLIGFLYKRNSGLKGENTKLKKNMKYLIIIALLACKPVRGMTKAELIDAIQSGSKLTKADAG